MQTAAKKIMTNLEHIKGAVAAKMDSASFTSWIAPLEFDVCDGVLVLTAQNQFSADFIGSVHANVLSSVAAEFGLGLKIAVRGASVAAAPVANDNNVQAFAPARDVATSHDCAIDAFDAFVCCDDNAFVLSACKKLSTAAVPFSPPVIYGPAGG